MFLPRSTRLQHACRWCWGGKTEVNENVKILVKSEYSGFEYLMRKFQQTFILKCEDFGKSPCIRK